MCNYNIHSNDLKKGVMKHQEYDPARGITEATKYRADDPVAGPNIERSGYIQLVAMLQELVDTFRFTYNTPPTNEELLALMRELMNLVVDFKENHGQKPTGGWLY